MILKKIHIDSFGKMQNYDLDLDKGLNIILHENGWGKSTLASFIRVMLYGFENEKKRSELENERRRYTPWLKGNAFGGYIVIQVNNKNYRIERFFEKTSDVFKLYDADTNLESKDYSERIGEEIFGINRDSFSKTVFVAQQTCQTEVTSEINAKIGNVSEEMADMARFESACEMLHNEQNRLTGRRATGLISKLKNEVAELKKKTELLPTMESSLDQLNKELVVVNDAISAKKQELIELHRQRDNLSEYNARLAERKEYDALLKEKMNAEEECNSIKETFGENIPEVVLIDEMISNANRMQEISDSVESEKLLDEEEAEYARLQNVFSEGIPNESELAKIKQNIDEIGRLRLEIDGIGFSDEECRKYENYKKRFENGTLTVSEIDNCISEWKKHENMENMIPVFRSNETSMIMKLRSDAENKKAAMEKEQKDRAEEKKKKAQSIILTGAVIIVAAIFIFVLLQQLIISVPVLMIGIGILIFGMIKINQKEEYKEILLDDWENTPELIQIRAELNEAERSIEEIEEHINVLMQNNNITYQKGRVEGTLYELRRDLEDYGKLADRMVGREDQIHDKETLISSCVECVKSFMRRYDIEDENKEFLDEYYKIQEMAQRYMQLGERVSKYNALLKRVEEYKQNQEDFRMEYNLATYTNVEQLRIIRENAVKYISKKEELERRSEALNQYIDTHDVSKYSQMKEPDSQYTADQLTEKITVLDKGLGEDENNRDNYLGQIEKYEADIEDLSEKKERLIQKIEEQNEAERRFEIVNKTENLLNKAKDSFLKHYLAPMQEGFDKYYTMLSGDPTDVYDLDVNFKVTKREHGQLRDTELLSEGYKDMVGLCRRIAMVNAMYEKEVPFLIFDDPFVNLDDNRVKSGIVFLEELAKEYQIIYTTCSSSRR